MTPLVNRGSTGDTPQVDLALSVVIPTRDRWELLSRTLVALAAQDAPTFEVIVVADGSHDDTVARLDSRSGLDWPASLPLRVVEQPWFGPAAARNVAIGLARAPRVLLLGDDTPPAAGTLRRHAARAVEAVGVQGRIEWLPDRPITPVMKFLAPAGPQFYFVDLRTGEPIPPRAMLGSNLSAPTEWFRAEPFDERFRAAVFEDTELAVRWGKRGWRANYDPLALCWHDHEYTAIEPFLARQRRAGAAARLAVRLHPRLLGLVVAGPALIGLRSILRIVLGPVLGRRGPVDGWDLRCRVAFLRGFFAGAPAAASDGVASAVADRHRDQSGPR